MLEEDKVIWTKLNNGKFSNKALYWGLEPRSSVCFLTGVIWTLGCGRRWVFLFGRLHGKMFNLRSFTEKRVVFDKQMFPLSFRGKIHSSYPYS